MKRSTKRTLTRSGFYLLLVAAIAGAALTVNWSRVRANFWSNGLKGNWHDLIFTGVVKTLEYTAICFGVGLALALVVALMKMSPIGPYRWIATAYIELFRGLPALIVIFACAFGVPIAFSWQPPGGLVGAGLLGLIMVCAAYMAETLRAGIQAVPKGQEEAARSLGMSNARTLFSVVLPQAFRIVTPPLTNELILVVKDSSLAYIIGLSSTSFDLTKYGRDLANTNANLTPLVIAGLCYLVITLPLTFAVRRMEAKTARAR